VYGRGKLPRLAVSAITNALDLHVDSIHLFRRGSYGSALALSILAAEELGKYRIVEDSLFQSHTSGSWTPDVEQEWLLAAYDHRRKQAAFCGMAEEALTAPTQKRIARGALERDKQRGVYVGLPRKGKVIDVAGPLSVPRQVRREQAERQITTVNDCFIMLCLGGSTGVYVLDIDAVYSHITVALASRLHRSWPRMGSRTGRFSRLVDPSWWRRRTNRGSERRGLTRG
jgi:AbiV family abortive infection protein